MPEPDLPESLPDLLAKEGLDRATLRTCLNSLHPVDLAEHLADVDPEDRVPLFEDLDSERAAQVLATMPYPARTELADRMDEERLAKIVDLMPDSAVADLLDHLHGQKARSLLSRLSEKHAAHVHELRQYDDNTAGGRMTRNFVTIPETFTAGETIKKIQGAVDSHTVDFVYAVDAGGRLRGISSLQKLMIHAPETPVARFMRRDVTFVGPTTDQEEVARVAQKYHLRAVPVVGNDMKLLGVVTLRDILEVIRHEVDEDIMKMAGAAHVDLLHAPFLRRLWARAPWLGVAMALELANAWIMKGYGNTLEHMALAYFIPVIMAMGGNVGLQSSTLVVRGLATGDLTLGKGLRVVLSELRVGTSLGFLAGILTGAMAFLMEMGSDGATELGGIVFLSMTTSMTIATTMGALTPLALQRIKIDPAVASGPFITAVNDVVNVTLYLSIATLLFHHRASP